MTLLPSRIRTKLFYVQDLSVSFDGFKALDLPYFDVLEGELRVIIGPNGAGKTTFMDVLCGKTKPDTGIVAMYNRNLLELTEKEIVEAGVARKFQKPSIFGSLTVRENLQLATKTNKGVWASLFGSLSASDRARIDEVAETIRLTGELDREAGYLSHGQKQWLEIGMVVLQDPKLLLIDEPAAGMTDEETERTGELLLSLEGKHTVIVIEHDMEFVRQIGRTVSVFAEGKLLVEGPMEEVQEDPRVIECYLGSQMEADAGVATARRGGDAA